ncbi:MAG: c-type cytochrome [Planctomycetes bacterium]|nr:c-type cytochrome [Planctomycetota bacterium]
MKWLYPLIVLVCVAPVLAQSGDHKGEKMPEVWREMNVPAAPPLSPEEAMKTFKVAPGFHIELVAAEPLVEDPIAMAFDGEGRLWVVEMRGYMPNVDGKGEDVKNGRIVVLEDTDHDGKMDKSTVFLDGLVMPRAISIVSGGVLVAEPPNIWYARDTDGDLVCDQKEIVFNKYGSQGPVEHTENGLMPALDNWLYNAKSDSRFQFRDGKLIEQHVPAAGQWGVTQDNYGRIFTNSNSSYLHGHLIPAWYTLRNSAYPTGLGVNARIIGDQSTWAIRVNPGVNRGYMKSTLAADGRLKSTTATCGPVIYRGDQFPSSMVGDPFIPEPAANIVSHFKIKDDGYNVTATQETYPDKQWGKRAFLASTDERFRPVHCYNGPDGCLYVVDMYRGILQHRIYVTTFLRTQILERGLDKPIGMGRIYRIVSDEGKKPVETVNLDKASSAELVNKLSDANGWTRDTAQRLLVERKDTSIAASLKELALSGKSPLGRIHALWTLEGMGAIDTKTAISAMQDADAQVRIAAMRVSEDTITPDHADELLSAYDQLSKDKNEGVKMQALLSFGMLPDAAKSSDEAVAMIEREATSGNHRAAIMSGLSNAELSVLTHLIADPKAKDANALAMVKELASTILRRKNTGEIQQMLALASSDKNKQRQKAVLDGIMSANRKGSAVKLAQQPVGADELVKLQPGINRWIVWPGSKIEAGATVKELTPEQQKQYELGQQTYMMICVGCHQVNGKGMAGLAPPLADSPIAEGPPERIARIVLNGLMGPVQVNEEEWNLVMPGLRDNPLLDDEKIAAVMTYVRRTWDNDADPVPTKLVQDARKATEGRVEPWTFKELQKIK